MATKSKSVRTLNAEIADLKARLVERDENVDYWFQQYVNTETRLIDANLQNENLKNQRDRQAKTIADQNELIDDLIEENLDLHFELNLAREIPKMAATVVQFANESVPSTAALIWRRGIGP